MGENQNREELACKTSGSASHGLKINLTLSLKSRNRSGSKWAKTSSNDTATSSCLLLTSRRGHPETLTSPSASGWISEQKSEKLSAMEPRTSNGCKVTTLSKIQTESNLKTGRRLSAWSRGM